MHKETVLILILMLVLGEIPVTYANDVPWWGGVISWYQNPKVEYIAGSQPIYVIVDPDNGPNDEIWSRDDIERLKASGVKVIAYLNIGFAEEWRDYWDSGWDKHNHPEWLYLVEYPGWPGEYFVAYWHSSAWKPGAWVDILKRELSRIISMGFDGVRLDNIDSCVMWENPEEYGLGAYLPKVENATEWMIYLVGNLSRYAKSLDPDFIILANMGSALHLLGDDLFLASIDAVEREDVWYSDNEPVDLSVTIETLYWLRYARDHGKDVVVTDYAVSKEYVVDALSKARNEGFYIFVALDRDLDKIPLYIPIYDNIVVVDSPEPIVAWSYQGVYNGAWTDFNVYIAKFTTNGFINVVTLSSNGSIDIHVSASYNPSNDEVLVAWETNENSVNCTWIKGALIDPSSLNVVTYVVVARSDPQASMYYPSVASFNGYFYISYVNGSSLYYALIDSAGKVIGRVYIGEVSNCKWTSVAEGLNGVLILWLDRDHALRATLVNGLKVLWTKEVSDQVRPYRYAVVYVPSRGYLIVYQGLRSGAAVLLNINGSIVSSLTNIPAISWIPKLKYVGNDVIVYPGVDSLHYIWTKSLKYLGSTSLGFKSVTGIGLLMYLGKLYALGPKINCNNTLVLKVIHRLPKLKENLVNMVIIFPPHPILRFAVLRINKIMAF